MCFSANALHALRPVKANGDAMPPAAVAAALAADPDIFRMHGPGTSPQARWLVGLRRDHVCGRGGDEHHSEHRRGRKR